MNANLDTGKKKVKKKQQKNNALADLKILKPSYISTVGGTVNTSHFEM